MYAYQKYKWECSSIKAVATWDQNVRKDRHLLVYVDGWTVQKKPATWTKGAKTTRNSNFPISK